MPRCAAALVALTLVANLPLSAQTDPRGDVAATAQLNGTLLSVHPTLAYERVVLQVVGPAGFEARRAFDAGQPITVDLRADGLVPVDESSIDAMDGQEAVEPARYVPALSLPAGRYRWAAFFSLPGGDSAQAGGGMILGVPAPEGPGPDPQSETPEDTTHVDAVFIEDGANDGVVSLSIDSDSSLGSTEEVWKFENRDGDLRFVEDGVGGSNQRVVMTMIQDFKGEVGLGTTAPAQRLHLVGDSFVGIRIDDVTSATSSWDIRAVGEQFQIEDVENLDVPFTIMKGAAHNSFFIDEGTAVGIGTLSPDAALHLRADPPRIIFQEVGEGNLFQITGQIEGNDGPVFSIEVPGFPTQRFLAIHADTGALSFGSTLLSESSGAHLTAGGEWVSASSRELKSNIRPLDYREALEALTELEPVRFNYKVEPDEIQVGFIAEDVPDLVATPERDGLASMDVIGVLTRVVQEQQRAIERLEALERERRRR